MNRASKRALLTVKNLSAGYGEGDIIRSISLTIREGDRLVVLGPNGCGKTTLIRAVTGILPSKGLLLSEGDDIRRMKAHKLASRIAVLGQLESSYFPFTVFETVMMGRFHHMKSRLFSEPDARDEAVCEAVLRQVDLWALKDHSISSLSGGQLQRVFLARTFAQEPNIIFLDEPTNHLDLRYQTELIAYLKRWADEPGHAVCGVLHDLNLAADLADQVLLLSEGETVAQGSWQEVCTAERLQSVFDMDVAHYMRESLSRWLQYE